MSTNFRQFRYAKVSNFGPSDFGKFFISVDHYLWQPNLTTVEWNDQNTVKLYSKTFHMFILYWTLSVKISTRFTFVLQMLFTELTKFKLLLQNL
jgi:hypothetical protein